jgi:hypothetical protein
MKTFALSMAAAAFGVAMVFSGAASATQLVCSGVYYTSNGTQSLPGTDVGLVQPGCQIGSISNSNNSYNGTGAFINTSTNPSVYQFEWGGGNISISGAMGNNGTFPDGVNMDLGLAAGNSLTASDALTNVLASLFFPQTVQVGKSFNLYSGNLASGTYLIDTFGVVTADPTYQINFAAVPEPMSVTLLGAGLVGAGVLRRRKSKKATAV